MSAALEGSSEHKGRAQRKRREGIVTSDAPHKTITVRVERRTTHPLYGKTVVKSSKLRAHDEDNEARRGDRVRIAETRPLARHKRWRLTRVLERAK